MRGTLRGLHFQAAPHEEAKLVRCTAGAMFDVALDLRTQSPTFRSWFGTTLSGENRRALYVPEGCAHGFLTLADATEVEYKISASRTIRTPHAAFAGTTLHSESNGRARSTSSASATARTQTSKPFTESRPVAFEPAPHGVEPGAGAGMYRFMERLFPICRSLTGDGVRETLRLVDERVPLTVHEVPSGTEVLDWTVPEEWNVRDAYIAKEGRRVVDFEKSNLHLVGYSEPFHGTVSLDELRPRLHTHPDRSDWVPYRTSYYSRTWGFCLAQEQLDLLEEDDDYDVLVDTTLLPGSLTYGECFLQGELEDEVLLTTHICHPSLANDNLSGIAVLTELGALLKGIERRLSYRLLFIPGTIGSITWLARNKPEVEESRSRNEPGLPRRHRATHLQAEPPRERVDRPSGRLRTRRGRPARTRRRLRAVGLGRAPVQLAGFQPARRKPQPITRRRLRRIPLLGGQHGLYFARVA